MGSFVVEYSLLVVVGYDLCFCCGIFLLRNQLLWNLLLWSSCCGIVVVGCCEIVVVFLLLNMSVVESLLWNLRF